MSSGVSSEGLLRVIWSISAKRGTILPGATRPSLCRDVWESFETSKHQVVPPAGRLSKVSRSDSGIPPSWREKNFLTNVTLFDKSKENQRFSDETRDGIVRACFEMGSVCTGALIVVEQAIHLTEYEVTGIELDCKISSQVLVNIFEHNTPLHDGAVIIRGNRITSATCYLPLSDNMQISKELGTRHRAALGMSEVCDALVIAVSEETGQVSVAMGGQLERGVSKERLTERLNRIQYRSAEKKAKKWKGWRRNEKA